MDIKIILSLSILIFAPTIFALIIASPWFPNDNNVIRRTSQWFAWILFIYSLLFLFAFNPDSGLQFIEELRWPETHSSWISSLGISYIVGLDGLSMPLVILTTFINLLAVLASKNNITKRHKFYYSMVFFLTTAILGVFCAQDLFLFFLFWEFELIPMYFLISVWGTGRAQYSAIKFVLYTLTGSVFMLAAILTVYFSYYSQTKILTFNMMELGHYANYPLMVQIFAFIGFFIGFSVKLPTVPLHTWLPDAHVDAPTPISMILAGVLLKMGAYGLLRFNVSFLPEALKIFAPLIALFAVINIIYAAMVAFQQEDMKKLVAYSSVSHMGIVLLGIAAMNPAGLTGAMFQMIAHGLISAGLFMLVGTIYLRTHTRIIEKLGGLASQLPVISGYFLLIALAGLGLPLLIGFAAETLVFYGAFNSNSFDFISLLGADWPISIKTFAVIGIIGIILTAAYILWLIKRVLFGPMFENWKTLSDTSLSYDNYQEILILTLLTLSIVVFGCYPYMATKVFEPTLTKIIQSNSSFVAVIPKTR